MTIIVGLQALKCVAAAAVYATHNHPSWKDWGGQAKSAVEHFFLFSGMLASMSLSRSFKKYYTSVRRSSLTRFLVQDFPLMAFSFYVRRLFAIWVFCQVTWYTLTQFGPTYFPPPTGPCTEVVTALWTRWWAFEGGCLCTGNPVLWFVSVLALYWLISPAFVLMLIHLGDKILISLATIAAVWNCYAVYVAPEGLTNEDYPHYYHSPQTHWQQYLLGVVLWQARSTDTTQRFIDYVTSFLRLRKKAFRCVVALCCDMFCLGFGFWQWYILHYRIKASNTFIDPVYRTTTWMALIVFLWSTPLAEGSILLRLACARIWRTVGPDNFTICFWIVQWPVGSLIMMPMGKRRGRVCCLICTTLVASIGDKQVLTPVRRWTEEKMKALEAWKLAGSGNN